MPIVEGDKTQLQSNPKEDVCPWAVDSAWLLCGENAATATASGANTSVCFLSICLPLLCGDVQLFGVAVFSLVQPAGDWCRVIAVV